jgi:hypothetical protein
MLGGWSTPRPGHFTPRKDPVPIGWAPGPVWTGAENLVPTGFRFLDRPARGESLYRLSYRGPRTGLCHSIRTVRCTVPVSEAYKQNFGEETYTGRPLRTPTTKWVVLIRIVQSR